MGRRDRGVGVVLFVIFLAAFWFNSVAGANITDPDEVKALNAVREKLIDPMKNLSNWNKGDPCNSNWTGVFCYNQTLDDGYLHLWKLQLMNMNLSGELSQELGKLSHLKILNFMWNNIGGTVPNGIGNLTNLELLLLNGNQLTGSLPDELGYLPKLRRMQIDLNHLSGSLPESFANLTNLEHFHLNNNSLSGEIPRELSKLPNLLHFLLDNNNLSGSLPAEFSELPKLQILQLDNNNFNGSEIPASYGNMSRLLKLSLRNCSLLGSIPDLSRIPDLSYIDLRRNQLSGPIPSQKLADNMTTIFLSHNNLVGNIPANFSRLPRLQRLSLNDNFLNGSVPSGLWQSTRDFRYNKLTNIVGSSSVPANITLLLEGNPLCTNESISDLYCGSPIQDVNAQNKVVPNDTFVCLDQGCPPPYENAPRALTPSCFCAAPLIIDYRLKSPGFMDFRHYQTGYEKFLTSGLSLNVNQLNISSIEWQEGPRLRMKLKLFPVYNNASKEHQFNTSEVLRIWRLFTEWEIPSNDTFGPYELLNFILSDLYKAEIYPNRSSSGVTRGALAGIIVGTILGTLVISAIVSFLFIRSYLRKYNASRIAMKVQGVRWFTYEEMTRATDNFCSSLEVGQGGYGKVYKGALDDGALVAIKRTKEGSLQGNKEFCTEIELLSRLHHRHLVSLVGYCEDEDEQMLVYEFMPNGTLRDHLSFRSKQPLSFATRMQIALGSARGILYLHTEANPPIFHRDIKATNILLDSRFTAKVADFGLSRLAPEPDIDGIVPAHVSTVVKGTPGYLDPEYFLTHKLTDKSDVYSLGVVFLELLTGMHPISHGKNIVREVNAAYGSGNILSVVDERMEAYPPECAERLATLALGCCQDEPLERPTMSEVVRELEAIIQMTQESESRSATESSYSNQTERDSVMSSSVMRTPFVSIDQSGSDLVSGTYPYIDPR
ncbi:hypothetical protein V2J09_017163 [Rumex salicifolius]